MALTDPKKYVVLIAAATGMSVFSVCSIVTYTEPQNSGLIVFVFLYLSIFLSSLGTLTLLGLLIRRLWLKGLFAANLANSLRQGLLLSFFLLGCLVLSSHGILYWWVAVSLLLPILAIEAFLNLKI